MKYLLAVVCVAFSLFGQEECIQGHPSHVDVRYRGPEGVGYGRGYTTLSGFLTPNWQRSFQPLLDVRGHMFDDGRTAVNAGIGSRWNVFGDWALGGNFFYDFRDAKRLRAHQLGPGLEMLSPWIDFRFNGYIPIGKNNSLDDLTFNSFTGQGNEVVASRHFTAALANIAGEVGLPVKLGPYLDPYFSIGSYYLFKNSDAGISCGGSWGGLARLNMRVFDGISIGGELSYDKVYKTRGNGFISLNLPLGPNTVKRNGSRWKKWYPTEDCSNKARLQRVMTGDVIRQEIIPICSKNARFTFDLDCLVVDATAPAGGNGTFEFPYNDLSFALSQATPGECLYVFPGIYDGPIVPDGNPLIGSPCDQLVPTAQGVSLLLPPLTPGSYPVLSNTGGTFVIFSFPPMGDIFIRGFTIETPNVFIGSAVFIINPGTPSGSFTFSCNRFVEDGSYVIINGAENVIIDDNEFTLGFSVSNYLGVSSNYLQITNNTASSPNNDATSIFLIANNLDSIVISNNFFRKFNPPTTTFNFFELGSFNTFVFQNNDVEVNDSPMPALILVDAPNDGAQTSIINNRLSNIAPGATDIIGYENNSTTGTDIVEVSNNISPLNQNLEIISAGVGADTCLSVTGNSFNQINLTANPGAVLNVNETAAVVSSSNAGVTVNTSGSVNFATNCFP